MYRLRPRTYQIQHLLKIAKKFFLDEIDLCDQPAHVLTDMNFYFREEQVSRMERRFILQLRHQHSMQWMELPVVLNLSVSGLVFLLCRFDLQCKDETSLFEVIVKWWKYEAEKREPHLQTIIDKALNTSELSADAVSRIVSSHVSEPDHFLFRFAETLPIESITTVRPARTKTDHIYCFELQIRQCRFKIWRVLIDIFTSPTPHYSTLHNYQKAHDLVHAAGLTFVKTRPHLHFEQPKNSHMPSLNCDLLFELDCKGKKTLLLIKFDQGDQEVNVELTICDPRETSYEIVRQGQLTVPQARCDKDARIYRVHRHYLFVVHGPGRSVIIYDLCEMKVKGKIWFEVDHSWFPYQLSSEIL